MAGNLLTSYGAENFQLIRDQNMKQNTELAGEAVVTVDYETKSVSVDNWYKCLCLCTISFSYVGMTRAAANSCAADLRELFTTVEKEWRYGFNPENPTGWGFYESSTGVPKLQAEISVQKHGEGDMYDVIC